MSFSCASHTAVGDLIVGYFGRDSLVPITLNPTESYHNRYGQFTHASMIGKLYGSKITSAKGQGRMYILRPTPELWTLVLSHRTQILYLPDIAFISFQLGLKPGYTVIESGTGSGSFSHSIARVIAPHGHLYTFEYHEERAELAKQEFKLHGLDVVTIQHRNVCKDGFGVIDVDAVFLDLPAPWEAIPFTFECFKRGRICCFSPCIEQVQRTCRALFENGFNEIVMYECLVREHEVKKITIITMEEALKSGKRKMEEDMVESIVSRPVREARGHTSYLTFASFFPAVILD